MRPRTIVTRFALVVAVAALAVPALASVAGASTAGRVAVQSSDSSGDDVLATLTVSTDNVAVRKDGKKKFKAAKDGQSLKEGDTIQTDATGTAEVDYGNDAFTRLDVNTTFTIVVLTDDQGARQVQGSLETGQTWNRTAALTESGSFEQEGAGANATVRGTAFAITCDTVDHCTFQAVVDDIDLTGLDGVTRLLTPLTECESTDSTDGVQRDLTGVLCDDISQIPADQLPDWILQNLIKDLALGLPDGGILTGTIVVTNTGQVVFVPATTPTGGGSGGGGPVVTRPQIDDPPIAVDYGFAPEGAGALDFTPSDTISVLEGESADFTVRIVPGFDGNLYVVFVKLPTDVGTVYFYSDGGCEGICGDDHVTEVFVRDGEHPDARYAEGTVFYFEAFDSFDAGFADCEDCVGVAEYSDKMQFYVENESGDLASDQAEVEVIVEESGPCAEDVEVAC